MKEISRHIARKSISVFLALLTMLSATGAVTYTHYCAMLEEACDMTLSGDGLAQVSSCCSLPDMDEQGCCSEQSTYQKASGEQWLQWVQILLPQPALLATEAIFFNFRASVALALYESPALFYADLPPPRTGRTILVQKQSFLI
jgi:hypothetical protein